MGLRYKDQLQNVPIIPTWWRKEDCGFTPVEKNLIYWFTRFGTYDELAKQRLCSARTIQRQLAPIFSRIGAKDRRDALNIFNDYRAPVGFGLRKTGD